MDDIVLDDLLKVMQNSVFKVDLKTELVITAYDKGVCIGRNLEFQEFIDKYCENNDLKSQVFDMKDFVWLMQKEDNHITFEGYTNDNDAVECTLDCKMIDESTVICNLSYKDINEYRIDALTNVYNKESITRLIQNSFGENPFALLIIDVDNFKNINDCFGHMFGDAVLAKIAYILKQNIPDGLIGRIGGDEFMALIPGCSEYQEIWDRLHQISLDIEYYSDNNPRKARISLSIGCSRFPLDAQNYNELFMKADKALYRGKRKGKKCFIIYNDEKHKDLDTSFRAEYSTDSDGVRDKNYSRLITELYDIISTNVNYPINMKNVIDLLGSYFICDRVMLYLRNKDSKFSFAGSWCNPHNLSFTKNIDRNDFDYSLWENLFSSKGIVTMDNTNNLEYFSPPLFELFQADNTKSALVFELTTGKETYGIIRFDACVKQRKWSVDDLDILEMVAKIIGLYLAKSSKNMEIENHLNFDSLTNIYNNSKFYQLANDAITSKDEKYVLYGIDMEHFSEVNEVCGYEIGDSILIKMARILKNVFGTNAIIARSIGAHFLILSPYTSIEEIDWLFNQINNKVKQMRYNQIHGVANIRFLMAAYIVDEDDTIAKAIDKIKITYNEIQPACKSRYLVFNDKMQKAFLYQNELALHMKTALLEDEFTVYLQPKIDILTGEILGAEALSRWNYHKERVLPPMDYIPLFERTGFITELDQNVFEKICGFLHCQEIEKNKILPISVNLSKNIQNLDNYLERLEKTRNDYHIPASLIEIEVTETAFTSNFKDLTKWLNKIKQIGYIISMDDFGSGNSNLELLSLYDFDVIKLDKMFIDNINNDKQLKILRTIINLTKELDIKVLCEGVETYDQLQILKKLGCDWVQGFYYDKPLPMTDFIDKYLKK